MAETILLDERLRAVAEQVREGKVVADVGTDHGYLVTHLVLSRKCPRGFACDINRGPLSRARKNIEYHGLGNRIQIVCTDGLRGIPADAVDDIVVAGMGGDLIARILTEWEGHTASGKCFVLQPMTKPEHLRVALYQAGFVLTDEIPVLCGKFVYTVMKAVYTGACVEVSDFFAWTGKLWEKPVDQAGLCYFVRLHELLCKKAEGCAKSGKDPVQALEYARIAQRICKKIEEWQVG